MDDDDTLLTDAATSLFAVSAIAALAAVASSATAAVVTPFHSASVPPLSLVAYAKRIVRYAKCGPAGLALGLVLFARYCRSTGLAVHPLTIHRLLLASVTVAAKAHFDVFYSNKYYAQVGGVSTLEMNKLELTLLAGLHFSAMAHASEITMLLPALCAAGSRVPLDPEGWPMALEHPTLVATAARAAASALQSIPLACVPFLGPLPPRSLHRPMPHHDAAASAWTLPSGEGGSPIATSRSNSPSATFRSFPTAALESTGYGATSYTHNAAFVPLSSAVSRRTSSASVAPLPLHYTTTTTQRLYNFTTEL